MEQANVKWNSDQTRSQGSFFRSRDCWRGLEVGRSREKNFSRSFEKLFARVTIKTWLKPETALEKSLAPRVFDARLSDLLLTCSVSHLLESFRHFMLSYFTQCYVTWNRAQPFETKLISSMHHCAVWCRAKPFDITTCFSSTESWDSVKCGCGRRMRTADADGGRGRRMAQL